ncbi:hypothetical protein D3C71_1531770 [compost metagenome]
MSHLYVSLHGWVVTVTATRMLLTILLKKSCGYRVGKPPIFTYVTLKTCVGNCRFKAVAMNCVKPWAKTILNPTVNIYAILANG